jgi:catechol-2,3-dioxygenase
MAIEYLEHVNIHSEDCGQLVDYYTNVLGMTLGDRPEFGREGAWLYVGKIPVLHLVQRDKVADSEPRIEHYAMRCKGLDDMIDTLKGNKRSFWTNYIPETNVVQIHTDDPDGNHVELAFSGDERGDKTDLSAYDGK